MTSVHQGGCLCGALRFETHSAPESVSLCHCRMCAKHTGAPFVMLAVYPAEAVSISGETYGYQSSEGVDRRGCAKCGATVYIAVGIFTNSFARHRREYSHIQIWRGLLSMTPRLLVETLFVTGVAAVIIVIHHRGGSELVPLLGLFVYAGLRILPSLHSIVYYHNILRYGAAALDDLHRDWVDLTDPGDRDRSKERIPLHNRITLENVSYT